MYWEQINVGKCEWTTYVSSLVRTRHFVLHYLMLEFVIRVSTVPVKLYDCTCVPHSNEQDNHACSDIEYRQRNTFKQQLTMNSSPSSQGQLH